MTKQVYVIYDDSDPMQLPLTVEDSLQAVATYLGVASHSSVSRALATQNGHLNNVVIERVKIDISEVTGY